MLAGIIWLLISLDYVILGIMKDAIREEEEFAGAAFFLAILNGITLFILFKALQ